MDVAGDFAGQVAQRDYRVTAKFGGTLKAIEAKVDGVVAGTRAHAHAVLEPFATVQVKTLTLDAADVDASRFAPAGLGPRRIRKPHSMAHNPTIARTHSAPARP